MPEKKTSRTATPKDQAKKQASDSSTKKQAVSRNQKGQWIAGRSGNPKGRKPNSKATGIAVTARAKGATKLKPRGKAFKGQAHPGGSRKGRPNRSTLWQQAMDIISRSSPELADALVSYGLKGDKAAAKWALEFAGEHRFTWKPKTQRETLDDIKTEMLAVQDGLAAGELTIAQAEKLQQVLEGYADKILSAGGNDRRTAFEQEKLALALIQSDEKARKAAWFLVKRFDQLQRTAIESGELSGPVQHPLVEVARAGVGQAKVISQGRGSK